jgi:zinc transporter 2
MNIRAAIIHIIGDIIQSIGVVIAALIIYLVDDPRADIADPICTMIFTVICIFTTVPIFKDCMSVLMEATPK